MIAAYTNYFFPTLKAADVYKTFEFISKNTFQQNSLIERFLGSFKKNSEGTCGYLLHLFSVNMFE